ncbi:unnamed protein product [Clavelina lepadiformis]|uniref:PHD-type domain-containing protein n=1 Tax=Clavelina lepadiformis TaxID=159417 RepID=A0ABP0F2D0_CLALP
MVRNKAVATNIPIIKTLEKCQSNGHAPEEERVSSSPNKSPQYDSLPVSSIKSGGFFKLGSPKSINTKDLMKPLIKSTAGMSPKIWSAEKGFGDLANNLSNDDNIPQRDIFKSCSSPDKKLSITKHVNGLVKTSPQSLKLTYKAKNNEIRGPNVNCNPVKSEETSDHGLFHISRMKAQPALYRKMFGIFKEGSDVLARWSDGLSYLGTVCKVSDFEHHCMVQFEDKSVFRVHFKDLQPINGGDKSDDEEDKLLLDEVDSDLTCALCRDGKSEPPNDIVLCDKCGQGYHQLCHVPVIDTKVISEDDVWQCRTCVFAAVARRGGADSDGPGATALRHMKQVLPYDISSLTWDKGHKTNTEEVYCYCGGPGDWYLKTLQCCRCQQWFHEACIQCLEYPILYGDRFFLFVCSICNHGNEYVKRLPMRWVDVVHLVLYNITIAKTVKYYDFHGAMIPFFVQHWESLQLGDLVHEACTRSQLKDRVLETLQNNKTRFQCGSESKKAKMSWGLRTRSPPVPPTVNVPLTGIIDEELLKSLDLRHGSLLLSDSPTPLKRSGPGDPDDVNEASPSKKLHRELVEKEWRGGNNHIQDGAGLNSTADNIFDRLSSNFGKNFADLPETSLGGPEQPKRRRGRPRKEGFPAPKLRGSSVGRGRGRPASTGGKTKGKDAAKAKKVPSFTSETMSVIPLSELFQDLQGPQSTDNFPGHVAYDKDLRRSMARYFGAEGRIACGERFRVLAKRVVSGASSDNGAGPRVEYLIEWEGYTAKQLHESGRKR